MQRFRTGFTLVELVVVLIIIVILLGLLLPPGCGSRESARSRQCSTNLRNFALGAIQYESAQQHFPHWAKSFGQFPGGADPSQADATSGPHEKIGTWAVALLPYLDAQPTYEIWTEDRYPILSSGSVDMPASADRFTGSGYAPHAASNLGVFQCPSATTLQSEFGRNSYVLNTGLCVRSGSIGLGVLDRGGTAAILSFKDSMKAANGASGNGWAGLIPNGSRAPTSNGASLSDMKDGQAYTVLFTENLQAMPWHRAGFVMTAYDPADNDLAPGGDPTKVAYDPTCRYTTGFVWHWADPDNATAIEGGRPSVDVKPVWRINGGTATEDKFNATVTPMNAHDWARPSSAHTDGVHMGFADGAMRFIQDSIDYRVYQAMMTPNGAESDVPKPDYVLSGDTL